MKGRSSVVVRSTCPPRSVTAATPVRWCGWCGQSFTGEYLLQQQAALRVQLGKHVVEQEERPLAGALLHYGGLGQLDGERRGALLAAGAETIEVHAVNGEGQIVAVGADDGHALAPLPLLLGVKLGGELRGNGRPHVIRTGDGTRLRPPTRTVAR